MFINVDRSEFQPWSFRRSTDLSFQETFNLSQRGSEIIDRVLSLASDRFGVQQGIFKTLEMSDPLQQVRIFNWLDYLLDKSFLRSKLFNEFLDTIIWAFREKLFVFQQTQYQFNTCKYYLDIIFKSDVNIVNLQKCKEAFLSICILSERPDLQLRSFTQGIPFLENVFTPRGVLFFDHLFNDNSRPLFFKEHFIDCSFDQLQLLISLLDGQSPRKLLAPNFHVTKKENALLHDFPLNLTSFHSESVERYILAVKLLKEAPESGLLLQALLETSHKFEEDLESFAMDMNFWKDVFRLLVRGESQLDGYRDVRSIVDYLEFQRYGQNELNDFSLKGRTFNSIFRDVEDWHEGAAFCHTQEDLNLSWKPLGYPDFEKTTSTSVFKISEITSGKRLLKESKEMQHCVFSYLQMCNTGKTHIFSLTEDLKSKGKSIEKSRVTIEVNKGKLVQAYGKNNSYPSNELVTIITNWCEKNGVERS